MSMKQSAGYYLKNLMLFERNKEWLTSDISWSYKIQYYPSIWTTYARMYTGGKRTVRYLGRPFAFDNPATPLNLQNYPHEITKKIIAHMSSKPKTILDIGGNIGQFSVTIKQVLGQQTEIDVFEPNKEVFELLQKNLKGLKGVRAFNYALGSKSQQTSMYFERGRSGTGSIIRSNASNNIEALSEVDINMIDSVSAATGRTHYDLVKIDVEGFEKEVLKALQGVTADYLFIEVSSGREKNYSHSEFLGSITKQFGEYDIVYASPVSEYATTFDTLLRIRETTT